MIAATYAVLIEKALDPETFAKIADLVGKWLNGIEPTADEQAKALGDLDAQIARADEQLQKDKIDGENST